MAAEPRDLADARAILGVVRAIQGWQDETGQRASRKPLREALWFWWQAPRLPQPRVRGKYPVAYLWSRWAREAYQVDPACRLVIEHAEPINLLISDLLDTTDLTAEELVETLRSRLAIAVVLTPEEDKELTGAGLRGRMPVEGRSDDPLIRYRIAGLDIVGFVPLAESVEASGP